LAYGSAIEQRLDESDLQMGALIRENEENLRQCRAFHCPYILIADDYSIPLEDVLRGGEES
jgi:hypothetical protein